MSQLISNKLILISAFLALLLFIQALNYFRGSTWLARAKVFRSKTLWGNFLCISLCLGIWGSFFLVHFIASYAYAKDALLVIGLSAANIAFFGSLNHNRSKWVSKINLLLISSSLSLVFIELALRRLPAKGFDDINHQAQVSSLNDIEQTVKLGETIYRSPNKNRIYEFIPNSRFTFMGAKVEINNAGFRYSPRYDTEVKNSKTIIGIGDSIMFGWGLEYEETFLHLAEKKLNAELSSAPYNIINTGVPGYNTHMEIATLQHLCRTIKPVLVILSYVNNDLSLPNFVHKEYKRNDLGYSYVSSLFKKKRNLSTDALIEAPFNESEKLFENDPENVPEAYRYMVGTAGYKVAMQQLSNLSNKHGFDVLVISHAQLPDFVKVECQKHNFNYMDTAPYWKKYCEQHTLEDPLGSWQLHPRDPHPSALGNQVIAEALATTIKKWGLQKSTTITKQ